MNADVTPALVAAVGGSALLAGIWTRERRADEAMRSSRERLGVRFPVGLDPLAAFAALDSFSGLPLGTELVVELAASETRIAHYLWVPDGVRTSAESMLRGVIPSLRITEAPLSQSSTATVALRLFVPTPALLHTDNAAAASRTLLAGLTGLQAGEEILVRWALRAGGPRHLPTREPTSTAAREIDRAWRRKTSLPGMRASGLVLVRAGSVSRARGLASHVESVVRSRRGLAGAVRVTVGRGNHSLASMPRVTATSGWLSTAELLPLVGWPLGPDVPLGVEVGASRELSVPRRVSRKGRRLFVGRDATGERPVAISAEAARHHMAVVSPTGGGKSVLLMRCVLDDLRSGYGGIVLDPKNDLAGELLERVPAEHARRMVVLDPSVRVRCRAWTCSVAAIPTYAPRSCSQRSRASTVTRGACGSTTTCGLVCARWRSYQTRRCPIGWRSTPILHCAPEPWRM